MKRALQVLGAYHRYSAEITDYAKIILDRELTVHQRASRFFQKAGLTLLGSIPDQVQYLEWRGFVRNPHLELVSAWLYQYLLEQEPPVRLAVPMEQRLFRSGREVYSNDMEGCLFEKANIVFMGLSQEKDQPLTVMTPRTFDFQPYLDGVFWKHNVWILTESGDTHNHIHLERMDIPTYVEGDEDPKKYGDMLRTRIGILYGPSGSGKTQFAIAAMRTIASCRILVVNLKMGFQINNSYHIQHLLQTLNTLNANCLILDDCPLDVDDPRSVDKYLALLDRLHKRSITTVMTYMHNEVEEFEFAGMRPGRVDLPKEFKLPSKEFRARILVQSGLAPALLAEVVEKSDGLYPAYVADIQNHLSSGPDVSVDAAIHAARLHQRIATASRYSSHRDGALVKKVFSLS